MLYSQLKKQEFPERVRASCHIDKELEPLLQDDSIYSTVLLEIPTPRFVVFYNGERKQPERRVLKLSDSFKMLRDEPELELKVTMLNINPGYNQEIMEQCQTLMEYMQYVATVREHIKKDSIEEAVPRAVDECIEKGVLKDFLLRNKAEVVAMSIFEYNEEEELKKLRASEFKGAALRERVQCIFELLEDYGEIPDDLKQKISSQRDKTVLTKWHKLAARVDSIEEFAEKINTDTIAQRH